VEEMIALQKRVRSPIVDGLFYPEEKADVLAYMKSIGLERGKGGFAKAIVAPHGAWKISGSLVGAAFASAGGRAGKESPSRVVIMGPVHSEQEKGIFLSDSDSFQTSLGNIPVDREATAWLGSYSSLFIENDVPHLYEHSIEVLLPFVKYCFPRASIVPILMSRPEEPYISTLANALRAIFEPDMDKTLLVISFNVAMHQGKMAALNMAGECLRLLKEEHCDELCVALQDGRITSCGGALIAALLKSGLVSTAHPCLASDSLLSTKGEYNRTVYYSAFSFI
jgi:AmmeMemoRadiSam system protein B